MSSFAGKEEEARWRGTGCSPGLGRGGGGRLRLSPEGCLSLLKRQDFPIPSLTKDSFLPFPQPRLAQKQQSPPTLCESIGVDRGMLPMSRKHGLKIREPGHLGQRRHPHSSDKLWRQHMGEGPCWLRLKFSLGLSYFDLILKNNIFSARVLGKLAIHMQKNEAWLWPYTIYKN